ncbi:MAG: polysaccharide deacetylase family protein [Sulfitobacter sp.]
MKADWSPLRQELRQWRAENRALPIWWRDDDAISTTPALTALSDMSLQLNVPVHLAIIPSLADDTLAQVVAQQRNLIPMIHGWAHQNHAKPGQKKAEFDAARTAARDEMRNGLDILSAKFQDRLLPIFVPPWNRIDDSFHPDLAAVGYIGISTFTARKTPQPAPGLRQINTHLDPIDWRGTRGLIDADRIIHTLLDILRARRSSAQDATEPLGYLTHHLVHDADIWQFSKALLGELTDGGAQPVNLHTLQKDLP